MTSGNASFATSQYVKDFNRDYMFDLGPTNLIQGNADASDDTFYAAVQLMGRTQSGNQEQIIDLPAVGTLVRVFPKPRASRPATTEMWSWVQNIKQPVADRRELPTMTISQPPLPTDYPRDLQSPPRPTEASTSSAESSEWKGRVISTTVSHLQVFNFPENMVVLKLQRPKNAPAAGRILRMTANISFGYPDISTAPQRNAVQNLMWGNTGRLIPRDTSKESFSPTIIGLIDFCPQAPPVIQL